MQCSLAIQGTTAGQSSSKPPCESTSSITEQGALEPTQAKPPGPASKTSESTAAQNPKASESSSTTAAVAGQPQEPKLQKLPSIGYHDDQGRYWDGSNWSIAWKEGAASLDPAIAIFADGKEVLKGVSLNPDRALEGLIRAL